MNQKAQLNMLETVTALAIIILAILFVRAFYGPPSLRVASSSSQLEVLANDILNTLDEKSVAGKARYHDSLLVEYIVTNDTSNFTSFLNQSLPATALYNIYVYNSTANSIYLWYPSKEIPTIGQVVKASRIFVYDGFVYEVELKVWYV